MEVFSEEFLLENGFEKVEVPLFVDATNYKGGFIKAYTSTRTTYTFKGVEIDLTADQQLFSMGKDDRTDLERLFECIGKSFVKDFKVKIGGL